MHHKIYNKPYTPEQTCHMLHTYLQQDTLGVIQNFWAQVFLKVFFFFLNKAVCIMMKTLSAVCHGAHCSKICTMISNIKRNIQRRTVGTCEVLIISLGLIIWCFFGVVGSNLSSDLHQMQCLYASNFKESNFDLKSRILDHVHFPTGNRSLCESMAVSRGRSENAEGRKRVPHFS